jgi:hypothetical protein
MGMNTRLQNVFQGASRQSPSAHLVEALAWSWEEKVSPRGSAGQERAGRLVWPDCDLPAWLDRALDPPP